MGVTSIELTIGTKTLVAAFFIAEVEENYSIILGRDWIHANECVPSTLLQILLQYIGDEVETMHVDTSSCIAMADAPVLWTHETAKYLTGVDFSDYQFIRVCREGFTPVMLGPMKNWLNHKQTIMHTSKKLCQIANGPGPKAGQSGA
jgi:hypothetical protein